VKGKVKTFYIEKGYGFITADNGENRDIFVHCRNLILESYLSAGDVVEFDLEETSKGLKAHNVRKVSGE